jgi:hypothetical protein
MKWYKVLQQSMAVILLSTISSCALPKADPSLTGQTYLNEHTQDRITFLEKGRLVITWAVCEKPWIKEFPYKFEYIIYKNDKEIHLIKMTSAEGFFFPYRTLNFSDSREELFFTDRNDKSGVFKKMKDQKKQ